MQIVNNFVWGLSLPFRAVALILGHPKLWPWVILPLIVVIAIYYYLWADLFFPWQQSISSSASDFVAGTFGLDTAGDVKSGVRILINILLACFFWIIALFSFSSVSNIATLPINDLLAEHVEPLCTPPLVRNYPQGFKAFLKATWIDLRKSLASILIIAVTFIFSWVPIMNIAAVILVALALTLQYSAYASTRRGLGVRASALLCIKNFSSSFGLGLACMVLLALPLVKLFLPPVAIVAGTIWFARIAYDANLAQKAVSL